MTMGIDETGNPDGTESDSSAGAGGTGSGGVEYTGSSSGESDQRAEHTRPQETGDPGDTGSEHPPAETRTREEYADDMRAQGQPIPSGDDPADDAAPPDEPDTPEGEPRNDSGQQLAEPRDRETYADDVRSDTGTPEPDHPATADDQSAGAIDTPAETSSGEPDREPAEPLSRDEYADAVRENPLEDSQQPDFTAPEDRETLTAAPDMSGAARANGEMGMVETPDERGVSDTGTRAGTQTDEQRLPSDVAHETSPPPSEDGTEPALAGAGDRADGPGRTEGAQTASEAVATETADPHHDSPAAALADGEPVLDSQGNVTHYHGEFKGQPVDLYTDGTRWPPGDQERGENVVGEKPDKSPGDTSDLPPTGEQLVDMENDKLSRFEGLRRESEKEENLDGLHSEVEHDANTIQKWLQGRPPAGHAEQPVLTSPQIGPEAHHYEVDAGSLATMGLMLGVLGVEAVRWGHRRLETLRGR